MTLARLLSDAKRRPSWLVAIAMVTWPAYYRWVFAAERVIFSSPSNSRRSGSAAPLAPHVANPIFLHHCGPYSRLNKFTANSPCFLCKQTVTNQGLNARMAMTTCSAMKLYGNLTLHL